MTILETLKQIRTRYGPTMTNHECADMLNEAAWIHRVEGYGLLADRGGNFGTRFDGKKVEVDILMDYSTGKHRDVIQDGGGVSQPYWGKEWSAQWERWVPPIQPESVPDPPPPDDPPAPPDDLAQIVAQLVETTKSQAETIAAIVDELNAIDDEIASLSAVEDYTFKASTSRSWGHSHHVEITPERK